MNKKIKIIIICISIIFICSIIALVFYINNKNADKKKIKEVTKQTDEKWTKYKEEKTNNKIYFYKNENDEIIATLDIQDDKYENNGVYYCKDSNCKIYDVNNKYAFIYDYDSYYFFDYKNNLIRKSNLNDSYKEIKIASYNDKIYGLILENENDKFGFYYLNTDNLSIDFNYDFFNDNYVTLNKENIIGYKYEDSYNNSFIINIKNGNILYESKYDINVINNKNNLYYYIMDENKMDIYNNELKKILNEEEINKFGVSDKGNIIISNSNYFDMYNNNGVFIKKSKEYKEILLILNDYVVVIDNDNYLKIIDYDSNLVHSFEEVKDNYFFNSEFSGLYKKDNKYGIYLIFENREVGKSYEYYFIPKTKKYGVIEENILNDN